MIWALSRPGNLKEVSFLAAKREVLDSTFMDEHPSWTPQDKVRFQSLLFGRGAERSWMNLKDSENKWLTAQNYTLLETDCSRCCVSDFEMRLNS